MLLEAQEELMSEAGEHEKANQFKEELAEQKVVADTFRDELAEANKLLEEAERQKGEAHRLRELAEMREHTEQEQQTEVCLRNQDAHAVASNCKKASDHQCLPHCANEGPG